MHDSIFEEITINNAILEDESGGDVTHGLLESVYIGHCICIPIPKIHRGQSLMIGGGKSVGESMNLSRISSHVQPQLEGSAKEIKPPSKLHFSGAAITIQGIKR